MRQMGANGSQWRPTVANARSQLLLHVFKWEQWKPMGTMGANARSQLLLNEFKWVQWEQMGANGGQCEITIVASCI